MKTNKTLALVLAVLMLLSVVPMFAVAANLPTPQNVQVSGGNEKIEITWDEVTDFNARRDLASFRVLYSTDKTNWLLAGTSPRDSAMDVVSEPKEGSFVPGTTYYFAVQSVSWSGEYGPISAPSAGIKYTSTSGELRAEWEKVMKGYEVKTTETGTKYNKVKLVKGEKVVFDNGLYTLTVTVTAVSAEAASLNVAIKNKTKCTFECTFVSWDAVGGTSSGESVSIHEGSKTVKVNLKNLKDGANYFTFSVSGYGNPVAQFSQVTKGNEYNEYADKLIYLGRKHTVYFQKAPNAGKIDSHDVAATKNTITIGKAYQTATKGAKGSGTIVYYRVDGTKKFSKKTFAAGKALKLTKLKANTLYEIKAINYVKAVSAADKQTVVTSKSGYSNRIWIRTAVATAPEIQSIKVSDAKVGKIHVNGYWESDGDWHPAYDVTVTTYKITVTLKSAPKGIQGIKVTGADRNGYPHWIKGTGKTFTINANAKGNARGKTVNIGISLFSNQFGSDSGYSGYSPVTKKAITIR